MLSRRLLLRLVILTARFIAVLVMGLAIGLWLNKLFGNLLVALVLVMPICLLLSLFVCFFGMSLRELEQARLILDVLENGLAQGQSGETAVVSICQSAERRGQSLGRKVHLLGAQMEAGRPLSEALKAVPGLVPPPVVAMLEVGVKVGDVGKVLPACRKLLAERGSPSVEAPGFVIVLIFVINPLVTLLLSFDLLVILPKLQGFFEDLSSGSMPPLLTFLIAHRHQFVGVCCGWTLAICVIARLYFYEHPALASRAPFLKLLKALPR